MLTVPRELVMMMPPRLQALVGYTQAGGLGNTLYQGVLRLLS
jgi:hypothetical protein